MKTSRSNREILLGNTLAARRQTCESPAMKPARLIVLTAVAALLLGSQTQKVLAHARLPVIVAR